MAKRDTERAFGWLEACLRYAGGFGPYEKRAYGEIFRVSTSTISRHQIAFAQEVADRLGEGIVLNLKGKLVLSDEGELPDRPLFRPPPLDRWLEEVMGPRLVRHAGMARARPKPEVLREIIASIRRRRAVEILYASRTGREPSKRRISPHTLVDVSGRYHVRAFDHLKTRYADFVLSRMLWCRSVEDGPYVDDRSDETWRQTVAIEVISRAADPLPGVRMDFDLDETGRRVEEVSLALAPYLVDSPDEGHQSPVIVRRKSSDLP